MSRKLEASNVEPFKAWITTNGGEVLAPTNPYEVVRFRADGSTNIIYRNDKGAWRFVGIVCEKAWQAFSAHRAMRLAPPTKRREKARAVVNRLIERDGARCFYCPTQFDDEALPTIEHLISVTHGGPDHIANKFLACQTCNTEAGHLSAVEKIVLREQKLGLVRRVAPPAHVFLCEAA